MNQFWKPSDQMNFQFFMNIIIKKFSPRALLTCRKPFYDLKIQIKKKKLYLYLIKNYLRDLDKEYLEISRVNILCCNFIAKATADIDIIKETCKFLLLFLKIFILSISRIYCVLLSTYEEH